MNRVLIDLGVVQIYWYSVCILIGMMIGMFLVYKETLKKGMSEHLITNLIFYTIIIAVIGARLYYVAFDWSSFSKNPVEIFEIWNGGLAIHGAIIFGGLFLIYYTRQHKMDTLKILDICSVGLIIGQAIGRWGNFFNQEVFGGEVGISFLKGLHLPGFIIDGMFIDGKYHHPLFLYESLWCILGFVILLLIRKRKYIKTGQIFGVYCMWYSFIRFFLEGMRDPEYNLMLGPIKVAQLVSALMFCVGLFYVVRRIKTQRFEYLYNDEDVSVETNDNNIGSSTPFFGSDVIRQKEVTPVEQPQLQPVVETTPPVVTTPIQVQPQAEVQDNTIHFTQATGPVLNTQTNDSQENVQDNTNQNNTLI